MHGNNFLGNCILNSNDHNGSLVTNLFVGKYECKTRSSFKILDSTMGKLTVQYDGLYSDSVIYLWGDGTFTLVKPSQLVVSKLFNKPYSGVVSCIAFNKCGIEERDTFTKICTVVCDTPKSNFIIIISLLSKLIVLIKITK